jgi:uncharacterized membrane protein
MQDLGNLPGDTVGYAMGVSADGSTVLGYSGTSSNIGLDGHRMFLWTEQGGEQILPTLPNTTNAYANAISGDGSTVLGINHTSTRGNRVVLWNTQLGVVDLTDYLGAHGVDLSRWTTGIFDPGGLSYDGRTIVGNGYYNSGPRQGPQGWVATIPAPSAAGVLGSCGLAMFRRGRRRA